MPEMKSKSSPPSSLRQMPPLPEPRPLSAARMTFPRGPTPDKPMPFRSAVPRETHVSPPSVVLSSPGSNPRVPRKLLNPPCATTIVWFVASLGSNSIAPIESEGN
jgi:hypothetical protein